MKRNSLSLRAKDSKAWVGLRAFEESIGGRGAIIDSLSAATLDWKQQTLLKLLLDPRRAQDSLAKICADAGVPATELIEHFREVSFQRALAEAQVRMMAKIPEVVEAVADAALEHNEDCSCTYQRDGSQVDPLPECPLCSGRGFRRIKASLPHQQMMFEASELLKKGGGVNVQVSQTNAVTLGSSFFDKFVKATDPAITIEAVPIIPATLEEAPLGTTDLRLHDETNHSAEVRRGVDVEGDR